MQQILERMKFEKYHIDEKIKKGLAQLGFKRPTDIQFKSIPNILNGEDLLAVAQTGTGKTAAYVIPILHRIYTKKKNQSRKDGIQCLIMVPTHELAIQVLGVVEQIAQFTNVKATAIYGGVEQKPQIKKLNEGVDVLIATPGRMFDLISQGWLRTNRINTLVLDEADHMLDLGFINDIYDLIKKIPDKRQTLFFSATISPKIKKTAYSIIRQSAIRIQISPKNPVSKNVEHSLIFMEMDHKRFFLERVISENKESKVLVFVRTQVRAERVAKAMERVDIFALTIHGGKDQKQRDQAMKAFREGSSKILIATDISARGIDIPDVQIVVNYDLPDKAENYVHRVGRTGRVKKRGHAYTFCSDGEKDLLSKIHKYIGSEINTIELDHEAYEETLNIERERTYDVNALLEEAEAIEKKQKKKRKK